MQSAGGVARGRKVARRLPSRAGPLKNASEARAFRRCETARRFVGDVGQNRAGHASAMGPLLKFQSGAKAPLFFFVGRKGDGSLLCRAPEGPFRQKTPVPFSALIRLRGGRARPPRETLRPAAGNSRTRGTPDPRSGNTTTSDRTAPPVPRRAAPPPPSSAG